MKTTKDYIVTENPFYCGEEKYRIFNRHNFTWMPYCNTFNNYGQNVDHDEFCGEEEEHYEVYAYTYWDGSNWKTVIIGNEDEGGQPELNEIEANKILKEMPDYPYIDGISESIETENYTFHYNRYATAEICSVD